MPRKKLTRRQWIKRTALTILGGGVATVGYTFWVEPFWVEVVKRDLPIANLPTRWEGRTLVQLSDIHVGYRVSDEYLIRTFARVDNLKPDVVVFTGDFVSMNPDGTPPLDQLKRVFEHVPRGEHATLGTLGNHDYGRDWSQAKMAERVVDVLKTSGVQVLRNEQTDVDGLSLVGLDELWAGRCDGRGVLRSVPDDTPRLVLCHNPDAADEDFWGGYQGWILAGHTHGGQCKPPFLPPPMLPVKNRRYTSGEFDLFDGRRMYINRGLGHLMRVRFNVRPEISVFRLVAA
jgi:predicted MPP superfamily phosphohydrolase